jgi:hypothetical protein
MDEETLTAIAKLAEDRHVRIELLPVGFSITVRAPIKGKGMIQAKELVPYATVASLANPMDAIKLAVDSAIAKLNAMASS